MFGFFKFNYGAEYAKELGIDISIMEKVARSGGMPITLQHKNMVMKNIKSAFPTIDGPSLGLLLAANFAIDLDPGDDSLIVMVQNKMPEYVQKYSVPVMHANCAVKMLQEKVLLDDVIYQMSKNVF